MVSKLDHSVGDVVDALNYKNMLENTIIIFLSDNGAPLGPSFPNWGSNLPFRGVSTMFYVHQQCVNYHYLHSFLNDHNIKLVHLYQGHHIYNLKPVLWSLKHYFNTK